MFSGRSLLIFQNNILDQCSGSTSSPSKQPGGSKHKLWFLACLFDPDDVGRKFLQDTGKFVPSIWRQSPDQTSELLCLWSDDRYQKF
jgi:hypothetical protein